MKIERINGGAGIVLIKAKYAKDRALFKHCAGNDLALDKETQNIIDLLHAHGVNAVVVEEHKPESGSTNPVVW